MRLSENDWQKYISKLSKINSTAADLMQAYIDENGMDDNAALVRYAYALATKYGEASGSLACEMYDAIAEASGVSVRPAEMAPTATYSETAKAVNGTMINKTNSVPQTVGRLVKQTASDTTLKNALRDGAKFAWVPHGDTCAFCIMLASNGWQYVSKNTLKNGHATHIHANCDCEYAISFDGNPQVGGYDPNRYKKIYYDAEGRTSKDKLNAIRRELYAKAKAEANNNVKTVDLQTALVQVYERRRITQNLHMVPYEEVSQDFMNPVKVELQNLSTETKDQFEQAISKLSEEYDTSLMKVRTMTPQETLGNTAFATTWHNYSTGSAELIINPVKCKDYGGMVERLKELRENGYIPKIKVGTEGQYIAVHEFAHTLLNMQAPISKSNNWVDLDLSKIRSARKEISKIYDRYVKEVGELEKAFKEAEFDFIMGTSSDPAIALELKKQLEAVRISRYSLSDVDEFMAEGFTDSQIGEDPTQYSQEVARVLLKYFGRK